MMEEENKILRCAQDDTAELIRMRDPRWNEEYQIKRVLLSIRELLKLQDLVYSDTFDPLIYFVLSLFPIEDISVKDGNVTEEYEDFLEAIPGYTLQEFYDKVMMKGGGEP